MNKKGFFIAVVIASWTSLCAQAGMECAGITSEQSFVTIEVQTSGAKAEPALGMVSVFDKDGNTYGYRIEAGEIAQYFEQDLIKQAATFVGLKAFVLGDNPVELYYSGDNYADQDLGLILKDPNRKPSTVGLFKVWRGPGYPAATQFDVLDFVCGVWTDQ
jgi:hypothetical protein